MAVDQEEALLSLPCPDCDGRGTDADEAAPSDMSALDITKERLAVIQRMAREGATDAVCATCQGTGIDPDPADLDPGNDQCPECKGSGRVDPDPAEDPPPVPPTGMGQPPIDHDKVTAAAEALNGAAFHDGAGGGRQGALSSAGVHP